MRTKLPNVAKRVLCIEDSDNDFQLLALAFRRCRIRNALIQATNWDEAAQHLEHSDRFGLIIVDLNLRKIGGVEILDEISRRRITIPTAIMTGAECSQARQKCIETGALFLLKPVEFRELVRLFGANGPLASFLDISTEPMR